MKQTIAVHVNGIERHVDVESRTSLVDMLRDQLRLTGTHVGCEHGVCGACTVLFDGEPIRACLMLAVQATGHGVETVESLGGPDALAPLQSALREAHAFQCGFCSPGILMMATALLESDEEITEQRVREELSGNLCRCTGYEPIVEGILTAARRRLDPSDKADD